MAIPCRSVLLSTYSPPTDTRALPARRITPRRQISPAKRKRFNRRAFLQFTPLLVRSSTLSTNSLTDISEVWRGPDLRISDSLTGTGEPAKPMRSSSRCYGPFFTRYKSHSPSERRCPLVSLRYRPPQVREYVLQLPKLGMSNSTR